jgi:hypothetical protein
MFAATCDRMAAWIARHSGLALLGWSVLFLGVTCLLGATKLMNFDELATYYPASQATLSQVWSFFSEGLDTNTPVTSLLVRGSLRVFGDRHLTLRLPMIAGYWLLCISIYAFVSYRCSKLYGLAAMLLPPVTSVYFYATEARAYGVLLGASAFALVCWQRAANGERRWLWLSLLGISLALCITLHYLTILLWVPLGLAELVRAWKSRKIDWAMWLVLGAALIPLTLFVPMMLAARRNFQGGFWIRPSWGEIENTYRTILTLAFAPMLGAVVAWILLPSTSRKNGVAPHPPAPLAERVLIGTLALTPFCAVPLMMLGGVFVPRYVLFTLTGLTILWMTSLYQRTRGDAFVALVVVACLGGWFVLKYPSAARRQMAASGGTAFLRAQLSDPTHLGNKSPLAKQPWMHAMEESTLPVVLSPAVFYLSTQYYSVPALRDRSYYLTSVAAALKYDGTDTGDRSLQFFRQRFPVQVPAYDEFVSTHREFLVCAETTNPTWVLEKLLDDGVKLQLVLRDGTYFVYHAQLP